MHKTRLIAMIVDVVSVKAVLLFRILPEYLKLEIPWSYLQEDLLASHVKCTFQTTVQAWPENIDH